MHARSFRAGFPLSIACASHEIERLNRLPGPATLIKRRNKIEKQLGEMRGLAARQRAGATLEANQRTKLAGMAEAEEKLRQVYLQGTPAQREVKETPMPRNSHKHARSTQLTKRPAA
jgi:hypothetical protein